MSIIISVTNQKGGVGKTTTAVNLAACLGRYNIKVLLIDADAQGNASSGLGINKKDFKTGFYEFFVHNVDLNECLIETKFKNLTILPANQNLAAAEIELVEKNNREFILKTRLLGKLDKFDLVIIDCPPALNLITVNTMVASDKLLIPMQAEYYSLEGLATLIETYRRIKVHFNENLALLGILITMFNSTNNLAKEVNLNIRQNMSNVVFDTIIPRNIRLAESPSYCLPIIDYDDKSSGAVAYQAFSKEILKKLNFI